jgi:PAS domain-containing protein
MARAVCDHPFHLDRQGRIASPASSLAKLLGYQAKDLEGERFDRYVTREDGPIFLEAILAAYGGRVVKRLCLDMISQKKINTEVDIHLEPEGYDVHGDVISVRGTICRCRERL